MTVTKKEAIQLAILVEQVKNIKDDTDQIIKHQRYQNGKLAEAVISSAATAVISLIVAIVTIISERPNV
jgi:hypothetical protein